MSDLIEAKAEHLFQNTSAEKVYDAWLDEDQLRAWSIEAMNIFGLVADLREIRVDARVGGSFLFTDMRDGEEARHWGTYSVLDRPNIIEFTWFTSEEEEQNSTSIVRIEITPEEEGCSVVLTHTMDAEWADYIEQTERGWTTMLQAIEAIQNTEKN